MAFDLHSRARSTLWLHRRQWARRIHLMKSRSIMSWVRRSCLARNDSGLPAETAAEGGGRRRKASDRMSPTFDSVFERHCKQSGNISIILGDSVFIMFFDLGLIRTGLLPVTAIYFRVDARTRFLRGLRHWPTARNGSNVKWSTWLCELNWSCHGNGWSTLVYVISDVTNTMTVCWMLSVNWTRTGLKNGGNLVTVITTGMGPNFKWQFKR